MREVLKFKNRDVRERERAWMFRWVGCLSLVVSLLSLVCTSGHAAVLASAYESYLYGDFQETINRAQDWADTENGLYLIANSYSRLGEYEKSRDNFRKLLKQYPKSLFYERSLVKFADTYFLAGDYDKSRALYLDILKKYPAISYAPTLYLRLAQVSSKQGRWSDKRKYLQFIRWHYPDCLEMQYVKTMEKYGDYFTVQIGAFSKKENAQSLKKDLGSKYPVYLVQERKSQLTLYRVRVGKYSQRKEVETVAEQLRNQGYPAKIYP